jgi:hypothetical protein
MEVQDQGSSVKTVRSHALPAFGYVLLGHRD